MLRMHRSRAGFRQLRGAYSRGAFQLLPDLLNTLACDQVIRPVMWRHSKMLRVLQQHHSCALRDRLTSDVVFRCADLCDFCNALEFF